MGIDKKSSTWANIKDMVFDSGSNMSDEMVLSQLGVDKKTMQGIVEAAKQQAMEDIKVKVKFVNHSNNEDPKHKHLDDSGMDLRANLPDGEITIGVGKIKLVPTGLHFELPESMEIQVRPRSGLAAKNNISVLNTPGTIDSDYRGELKVILFNHGNNNFLINNKDRIAQMILTPVIKIEFEETLDLPDTVRGTGGFGSTGK